MPVTGRIGPSDSDAIVTMTNSKSTIESEAEPAYGLCLRMHRQLTGNESESGPGVLRLTRTPAGGTAAAAGSGGRVSAN